MSGASRYRPPPSAALAEMLARDSEEAPLGGFAGESVRPGSEPSSAPVVPLSPIRFPAPPWSEQYVEDTETYPVKRGHRATGREEDDAA